MNGSQKLIETISKHITLTKEEQVLFPAFWSQKTLEKGDYLLRNGEVCRMDNYIISGTLKAFCINADNGNEEILYFAIDDWWATDMESFHKQVPSMYNIQALEKTELLQINFHSFQKMMEQIPSLERYFRIILESYVGALQKRIIYTHIYNAEKRYLDFLQNYPFFTARIPQYMIASYLGISAEFLSRLRKKNNIH